MKKTLPQFPFGAVYYRKSNPPEADWERDTAQAAREAMNIFRHWFLWGNIEVRPGEFTWDDYDRHMDLAQKYGLKVVIAEHMTSVPMWLFRRRPDLFARGRRGEVLTAGLSGSSASGNFACLCLDHPEGKALAGTFLTELVNRYRGHPALLGYDVANEGSISSLAVFHPNTIQVYREWLRKKYGSLDALNKAWRRYSMADWQDVEPTDFPNAPLPEALDLWRFKRQHYYEQVRWRIDLIRELDPDSLVLSHGTVWTPQVTDHWMFAEDVDLYGFTYVACRHTNASWKAWFYTDITRAAACGKPFWHAEAQGGPLWLQPQGPGRRPEDGRVATAENVRIWTMISMAGGSKGMLFVRWRGLLDPPLWDAFGLHNLDGSPNDRSRMAARLAVWTNHPDQADLMQAQPVRGEVALLYLPEALLYHQNLLSALPVKPDVVAVIEGAYQGLFDRNIQVDLVSMDQLEGVNVLYLSHAIQLHQSEAERLKAWVAAGGVLIAEGCPGYFDDNGRANARQPGLGLDELFGAQEKAVEFMPDLGHEITFTLDGCPVRGGLYRQVYQVTTGKARGYYPDGTLAVVENAWGNGRTLLVGTFPSVGYAESKGAESKDAESKGAENAEYFRSVIAWSGVEPRVTVSAPSVTARVHQSAAHTYLWVLNTSAQEQQVAITLSSEVGNFVSAHALWGHFTGDMVNNALQVEIPAQDALVLRLQA